MVGRNSILCPGPGHSRTDRSLSVTFSSTAPDGFVVNTFSTDDPLACRDHVRARLGIERQRRDDRRCLGTSYGGKGVIEPKPPMPDQDDAAKIARAVAIWDEAEAPRGTIVEQYLASRGLELPLEAATTAVRFHPACPWRDEASGRTIRVPAMVCAMRNMLTEGITAVHRTRLTPGGGKVGRRMLGRASGAAVMLMPMSGCGVGLAIGEGVETTIAAMQMGWRAAWALGSVGAIERLPLLPAIQSVVLLAETGDDGANARAIDEVGRRYSAAGCEVLIVEPRCGGDLNDALRAAA